MQYMLLIYGDETIWADMPHAEAQRTLQAYVDKLGRDSLAMASDSS